MTENLAEGNQPAGGEPTPSAPGQPSENSLPELTSVLKTVSDLQATVRALQSGKDKRWETEVGPMKDQIAKVAQYLGIDEKQARDAQRSLALDEIASAYLGTSPSEAAGTVTDNKVELQTIEASLELPPNDPRVTDLKLKYGDKPDEFLKAGIKLKVELEKSQSTLTPAEGLLPDGSSAPPPHETDEQKVARVMGSGPGFFDLDNVRKQGGGVLIRK